jgi:hypothetical protein
VAEEGAAPETDRTPSAVPERPPTRTADTGVAEEAPAEPVAAAPAAAEPVAEEPKPGRLSVTVFPWGDVWIDGKHRGKAPVRRIALPPGRHKVSAGQGKPSKTRMVRLKAGQGRSVQFDLSKE